MTALPVPGALPGWGPADRTGLDPVDGGMTAARGAQAAGTTCGLKASGAPDLALLVTPPETTAALVTTDNRVKAPCCTVSAQHAADGRARAVVVNSGNANVATPDDLAHTHRMVAATAAATGVPAEQVLVMSTGVIGVPLPVERIEAALPDLAGALSPDGGPDAARAMLTTDTRTKQVAYRVTDEHGVCTIGGAAKGVGMIEPSMATMLAVITTDAPIHGQLLRQLLRTAVGRTFNRISVDGDTSTSDQVALLATGQVRQPPGLDTLQRAVEAVCADLAHQVVADGEGAERVAAVTVSGATDEDTAARLARTVATSLLVRAALHGADPNWGRVLMALGGAGVDLDPRRVHVRLAGHTVCRFGVGVTFDAGQVSAAMDRPQVTVDVEVGAGPGHATVLTCDLTPEYVRFNAEYTT